MNIKILGGGCYDNKKLYENTKKVIAATKIKAEVEYITDMQKIMEYGVMKMPALVVNEQVVAMGKVLKPAEIVKLLHNIGF